MKHYSIIGIAIYFSSWVGVALLGLAYCNWHEVASTVVLMPLISLAIGTAIVLFLKFVLKKERRLATFYRSRIQKTDLACGLLAFASTRPHPLVLHILHGHPQSNDTLGLKILALLSIIMAGEVLALDVTEEIAQSDTADTRLAAENEPL